MFLKHVRVRPILLAISIVILMVLGQSIDRRVAADKDMISLNSMNQPALIVPPGERQVNTAVNCSDTTCPAAPAGLDKCVERTKFCVYYTTASISETEADWAADIVQYYWNRFVELGFGEPKYSGKLEVQLTNIGGCNGGSDWGVNYITTYAGCFDDTTNAQRVLGHELTHRLQYAHDTAPGAPISTKFLREGTARALEDNWFTEIDNWADALSFGGFNSESNAYLLDAEYDITSFEMRYKSCLWWKYAMEQYGTDPDEPELGIDFVQEVYDQVTAGYAHTSGVNQALSAYGTGINFNESFKRFGAAIWMKDLTGVPARYNFIDEEEAGNPAVYGPLDPEDGGIIQIGDDATWSNQGINKYGLRYFQADVGANCPVVSASFHKDDAGPAFYHIITQHDTAFNTHVEGSGTDWTQAFLKGNTNSIVAVVGSLENSSQVDITLSCANPVLDIKLPNSVAVARVQPATKFLAQVQITNGSAAGPVVAGLSNSYFTAQVGGQEATVVGGGFIQEQYWLLIQAPASLADGVYDLEITLSEPGSGTSLASDTSADSVVYTLELVDQALVIDRSGSMLNGTPTRLSAAEDAASFYVDVTRDGDGLAVVPYNEDINPAPFDLQTVTDLVRENARTYIDTIPETGGTTSIGDGLAEALSQLDSSTTGNSICSFVLLSDGMENTEKYWSDVRADVIASGCPVTTIAFGPESNETLMQEIASDTGGLFFYNDVYVSAQTQSTTAIPADMALDLGNTYEYAQGFSEDRQRLMAEKGIISAKEFEKTHAVLVDDTISEAIFSLDWFETFTAELELRLIDPDGKIYEPKDYSFKDDANHHVGYRITSPIPGTWFLKVRHIFSEEPSVPYQVIVSARSLITLELLLPDRLGLQYLTGNLVPIYAILSADGPIPEVVVDAIVTSPDGTQLLVPMFDDGEHDDGSREDGLYAGLYTAVNQAESVPPTGEKTEPSTPNDEGAYRVLARATSEKFYREAMGAFSVKEAPDLNGNRLPDPWEELYGLPNADPQGDPDRDLLVNYLEYYHGTNPVDSDSDDGGQRDGSEVSNGLDPLNPSDDLVRRPDFLLVRPWNNAVLVQFDLKPEYSFVRLFRRLGPTGDWGLIFTGVPGQGAGIITDTQVTNGQMYFYYLEAIAGLLNVASEPASNTPAVAEVVSSELFSEGVVPSADPILPEAYVIINSGALSTITPQVTLTFGPYEQEGGEVDSFSDITQVMLSNKPDFAGATWQDFEQGIPWTLEVRSLSPAFVYARFKDSSGNLSLGTELDSIFYQVALQFIPLTFK
ncbi:MAG: VWA domain-containing protein [Acidobacteriaceae bacterium]